MPLAKRLQKNDLIVLIELPPTQFGLLGGETSFDIYSSYRLTARGINYLGAAAKRAGFTNIKYLDQYHGNINSYENRQLLSQAALIGVSTITRTGPQSMTLLDQYRDKITVAGGFDASFRPQDYADHSDYVVIFEGDATFPELLQTLAGERGRNDEVAGIAFKRNGIVITTNPRARPTPEQLSIIHPDYDEKTLRGIGTYPVEDSRGCPKNCNFCTVTRAYGRSFRNKDPQWVVDELRRANNYGKFRFFTGDNFIGNPLRAKGVLEAMIESGMNNHPGIIQSTIQLVDHPDLMDLMRKAGIRAVCLGIESIDDEVLKGMKKGYNGKRVAEAVQKIRERGFWVHGMFVTGTDEDNPKKLRELTRWAPENVDSSQLFILIPLPGSEIGEQIKREGRLLYSSGDEHHHLYEGDHALFKPINFKNALELQEMHYEFYEHFYSWKYGIKSVLKANSMVNASIAIGLLAYTKLHGKKVLHSPQSRQHVKFLESLVR